MLKQAAYDGNHLDVFGISLNARHQAGNAAHEQRGLHACLRSLGDLVDDVLVGNGVRLEYQAVGLALFGKANLLIDLMQDHRLDLQRCNGKLLVAVGSIFQAHVAEELGGVFADALIGGDVAEVGVQARSLLVVVAGAQLRDVLDAVFGVARDGADLRVHLEIVEAVDHVGARLLEALRPLDVVRFVEACAQFEQRRNLLAVFCGGNQSLCQMRLACQAVQRDLDREHGRVVCGFTQQADERVHAFVRVHQQGIALGNLFHDGALLVEACRPLRGERLVGDLAGKLGINHARKAPCIAHVKRHAGYEALVGLQVQALQQELLGCRRKLRVGLQAYRSQASALLQHALHVLAVVVIQVFLGAVVRVDVGVARYADNAGALGGVHGEHLRRNGLDGVFQKDVLRAFAGQLDNALRLVRQRDKAERRIVGTDVLALLLALALGLLRLFNYCLIVHQTGKHVQCAVFQVREGVARIDDLRRKVRDNAFLQVRVQIFGLFLRKVGRLQLMDAVFGQLAHDFVVDAFLFRVQFVATLVDGKQLLAGRHLRFVVAHVLIDQRKVGKAAHAHHEELLQIAAEDGYERKALKQRHVMVFALVKNAFVEGEPGKLAVLHVGQNVMRLVRRRGLFGCSGRGAGIGILFSFHCFPSILLFPK